MKQVAQRLKKGDISVSDVPPPALGRGGVLVRVAYSLISAGTEKAKVDLGKMNLLQKARSRPQDVKAVLDQVKQYGLSATYRKVVAKLAATSPLGYSVSGVVLAVDDSVHELQPGDRVACGGAGYATHAGIVFVPKNLCVKVPPSVPLEDAAYTTLGAIALQGVRQAEVALGESIAVIGLGLLGLLTVQYLKAAGCRVIAIDVSKDAAARAKSHGADVVLVRSAEDIRGAVFAATRGRGADAVILTAATKSNDPFILAGEIARERARVILVGDVKIDVPREVYYRKELEIRLSRSYGPGRYDPEYEEGGHDYPVAYVRWTEQRNMEEFLDLLAAEKVDVRSLTTHVFPVDEAAGAYDLIGRKGSRTEPYVGILLKYEEDRTTAQAPAVAVIAKALPTASPLNVGFIGAGSYAQSMLLPALSRKKDVSLVRVVTAHGLTASSVSGQFGFAGFSSDPDDVLNDDSIGTVFIATRHGSHARYVVESLRRGKNVFVEKPLALNEEELAEIETAFQEARRSTPAIRLMVGFNRRFAPSVVAMKDFFKEIHEPLFVQYRVNAGFLPKGHWTHDPVEGGGRIIGEVCHFVDAIEFFTGQRVVRVFARAVSAGSESLVGDDNAAAALHLADGSLGVITYVANGDASVPKERIEVSGGLRTAILDNFTSLSLYGGGTRHSKTWGSVDKGQTEMLDQFLELLRYGGKDLISFEMLRATTRTTFAMVRSIRTGEPIEP